MAGQPFAWLGQLSSLGRLFGQGLGQLLYPNTCWVCQKLLTPDKKSFCDQCREVLTHDPHATCWRCSSTVGLHTNVEAGCGMCRGTPFAFEQAIRLGPYEGLLREVILRMKYGREEGLAEAVGELWAECAHPRLASLGPDVVIPVPLHWRRYFSRGYNQSEVLARCLAGRLRLPCRPRWLRRKRATPPQTGQSSSARWENVRGAFAASGLPLAGKTVLIVDDVLTTGSTASEAARALRGLHPKRIIVAVLAHGR